MFLPFKTTLKNTVRRAFAAMGVSVVRAGDPRAGGDYVAGVYRRLGIDTVLDIGANDGLTGTDLRQNGYRGQIISFEPQAASYTKLVERARGDDAWQCHKVALGETRAELTMQISGFSPSSSLLPIGEKHLEVWPTSAAVATEQVQVWPLDEMAADLNIDNRKVLIKVDTQGYEVPVLRGAAKTLQRVSAAYVELLFAPLYDGQSRYHEVMGLLDAAGLRFVGLFEPWLDRDTGYPLYADGLFVREQS